MDNEVMTPDQVAIYLRVAIRHVYKLIKTGKLKTFNVGDNSKTRRYRITKEQLNKYIEEATEN